MRKPSLAKKIYFISIILLLFSSFVMAHEGGHFHKVSGDHLKRWELSSGEAVYGNFSAMQESFLLLEGYEGKLIRVPLNSLSYTSRKIAYSHQGRITDMNQPLFDSPSSRGFNWKLPIIGLLITLGLILRYISTRFNWANSDMLFFQRVANVVVTILLVSAIVIACKKSTTDSGGGAVVIPKTSISFLDSAFAPYLPGVTTFSDNIYYFVSSSGLPAHNMMVGISSWQQQVPIPQPYGGANHWSIPLQPVWSDIPLSTRTNLMKGAVAIAVNGIPIFNALNNRGVDSYATGELDQWGGHCGRADDYHYHAAPLHLSQTSGRMPIAFALDGFPVYGSSEPDGSLMQALDTCHGHQLAGRVYHYHGTTNYPYVIGAMRGKVTLDPATPAPENQILPQAFASPVRPATTPLNGAVIIDFISTGSNAYKLTYRQGGRNGYVEYNWNTANIYTYKLTDTAGRVTINTYQR